MKRRVMFAYLLTFLMVVIVGLLLTMHYINGQALAK